MAKKPTLELTLDDHGFPTAGKCSACGAELDQGSPRGTTIPENAQWFESQFNLHVRQIHPPQQEDVNQADARVVRKPTEKD